MKRSKTIFIITACLFNLVSCSPKQETLKTFDKENLTIKYDSNIFTLLEKEYYILFYTPKCKACLDTLKYVEYKYNEKNFDIYLINVLESSVMYNKQITSNINCNDTEDFYLFKTPYLITLQEGIIIDEASGFNEIRTYLNQKLL
jgi:thiol-disulfide isomerase/thioredoxin